MEEEEEEEEKSLGSPTTNDDFGGRNPSSEVAGTSCPAAELVGIPAMSATAELSFRGETIYAPLVSSLNYRKKHKKLNNNNNN